MVPPMADEFYEKYKHLSHQELYKMLRAGAPRQVDGVGDTWAAVASTLDGLTNSLRQDLTRLLTGWSGSSGDEIAEGLAALARRAQRLAEEATAVRTGLTTMAQALADAQSQAEAPQPIPPAAPTAATQAVGSVLGTELGHQPTPEELARARERMVWLVARLAAQYGVAEHANWPAVAQLPSAVAGGAVAHVLGSHDERHRGRRHGSRLEGVADLARTPHMPSTHLAPMPSSGPHVLTPTSAESTGVFRGAPRAQSVHVVNAMPDATATATTPGPAAANPAASGGTTPPPPPLGLGGAGGLAPHSGVIGGHSTASGISPAGGAIDGGGLAADVTWQAGDAVEWMDPEDAAPPVIGG